MKALLLVVLVTAAASASAAEKWLPITPEELQMTAEAKAPGAPAIILYRQVDRDDSRAYQVSYVRIKILADAGIKYANVEIPFVKGSERIHDIEGRTIHADGTIAQFDGHVYEKPVGVRRGQKLWAKTFVLPDAQVGSIVEYRLRDDVPEGWVYDSHWVLTAPLFTKYGKFSLAAFRGYLLRYSWPVGLPPGTSPPAESRGVITLETRDVPAFVEEEFMPPAEALQYRVDFIYYPKRYAIVNGDGFWNQYSKDVWQGVERYVNKPAAMREALATIVQPTDSAEVKLRKIYARVQQLRNTSFEARSDEEALQPNNPKPNEDVVDVWSHGYGTEQQINWLFLGLARAAGLVAEPLQLASRDRYFFNPAVLNPLELNDTAIAIKLDGDWVYANPGVPFTPYAALPWWETAIQARVLDDVGGSWTTTAAPTPEQSRIERKADLQLSDSGELKGRVTVTYVGLEAQSRRFRERSDDDTARKQFLEDELKSDIPLGSDVKLVAQPDWNSSEPSMTAEYELSIPGWLTPAGRRAIAQAGLFSANEQHVFIHTTRAQPIYFEFPYEHVDDIQITLPADLKIDALPAPKIVNYSVANYKFEAQNARGSLHLRRDLSSNMLFVQAKYYDQLREFFQVIRSSDEQQIVLSSAPRSAPGP